MAPTKEEECKLKEFKDESPFKLGPAERFLRAVLDIPFAFKRVDAMLYIANFDSEVEYLKRSFDTLEVNFSPLHFFFLFAYTICAFRIFYSFKHLLSLCASPFYLLWFFSAHPFTYLAYRLNRFLTEYW